VWFHQQLAPLNCQSERSFQDGQFPVDFGVGGFLKLALGDESGKPLRQFFLEIKEVTCKARGLKEHRTMWGSRSLNC
jgi:hypothetical protein